jgi:hypothetical protein
MILTEAIILEEIVALAEYGPDFDTANQTTDTCIAVGAHDALRWALGFAETPLSEYLYRKARKARNTSAPTGGPTT